MANDFDLNIGNNIRMRDTQFINMFWLKTLENQVKCILPCILLEHTGGINLYFDTKHDLKHRKQRNNVFVRCFDTNNWNIIVQIYQIGYIKICQKPSNTFKAKRLYLYSSMLSATAKGRYYWWKQHKKHLIDTFSDFSRFSAKAYWKTVYLSFLCYFPCLGWKSLVIACSVEWGHGEKLQRGQYLVE